MPSSSTQDFRSGRPQPGEFAAYEERGLAFQIAGHELRHLRAVETLYLPRVTRITSH